MQLGDKKLLVQRASVGSKNATLVNVQGLDRGQTVLWEGGYCHTSTVGVNVVELIGYKL